MCIIMQYEYDSDGGCGGKRITVYFFINNIILLNFQITHFLFWRMRKLSYKYTLHLSSSM